MKGQVNVSITFFVKETVKKKRKKKRDGDEYSRVVIGEN
jgi:hypothetical protein